MTDDRTPAVSISRKKLTGLALGILLPSIVFLYPGELDFALRLVLAISTFTVAFWTFETLPIDYTSLLVLLLFPLLGLLPFEVAFAAFSGKAVWLIFSGLALSLSITETPLGARLAQLVLGRIRSYGGILLGVHLISVLLTLLIPSGLVRILILMPVIVSLLRALGEKPGSPASAGLVVSLACATYYCGTGVLTASVPNLVVLGVLESRGFPLYWGEWAVALFPVIGLLRTTCCYVLVRLVFPVRDFRLLPVSNLAQTELPKATTSEEKKAIGIFLLGVLLWATDALHGVHPAYVGLGLVLLCYFPGWGLLSPKRLRNVNFPLLIYIAAMFAVGRALETTGFSTRLAAALTHWIDLSSAGAPVKLGAISCLMIPFGFLTDTAAIASILTPVLLDFGNSLGLPSVPMGLSVAIGASLVFIPYQAAPFVVAYSFRYARMGQFILLMSLISLVSLIVLLPLNLLYWHLIGLV